MEHIAAPETGRDDNKPQPDGEPRPRQCTAMSHRSGQRCRKSAIKGGTVCATHGGSAPQVRLKARQRLDALVLPAIEALAAAMKSGDVRAALRAAAMVLDRAGFPAKSSMDLKVEDCDTVLSRVLGVPVDMLP